MPRPTSTHEQRESVRLLAIAVGVREAARQLGLNESRVQMWSMRYGWNVPKRHNNPVSNGKHVQQDCDQIVTVTADSLANHLETQGKATKLNLSEATHKASKVFSRLKGASVIRASENLTRIVNAASKIHSWESAAASNAVNLNVLSGGRAVVQVKQN